MSSTNKTLNYELSQFIGSDKPTYLGDYNSDMLKIDTALNQNKQNIESVGSTANTAQESATTALQNAETAQITAENAQTTANNSNNTATIALNKANQNEVNISKFNLTNIKNYTGSQIQLNHGSISAGTITVASNSDGSIGKIYGTVVLTGDGTNQLRNITIPNTDLRPKTNITISPIGIFSSLNTLAETVSVTIDTEGNLTFGIYGNAGGVGNVILNPVLLFMSDFGDVPVS